MQSELQRWRATLAQSMLKQTPRRFGSAHSTRLVGRPFLDLSQQSLIGPKGDQRAFSHRSRSILLRSLAHGRNLAKAAENGNGVSCLTRRGGHHAE